MGSQSDRLLVGKRFDFSSEARKTGDAAYEFAVVEMEGFEAISQPFRFTLTLVSNDASVEFDAILSNRATFTIYGPDGATETPYHGVLAEFDQMHRADGYVFYRAVLVPRLWNLSLFRISEAYLDEQPITDTLKTVLELGELTSRDFDFKLTAQYRPRSFVCQYEETYLDFMSRWMENEGIYYYFDHRNGADTLIVVDSMLMHEKARKDPTDEVKVVPVAYRPDDRMDTGVTGDSVRSLVCRQKPLPKEVILQEFNYRKAALHLKASAVVSASGRGQVMLYGENFRDEAEGRRYAKLRAEEILCSGKVFFGEGAAVGLRAGNFATMSGHYRDDFNGEYLITEIHHRGSQAGALLSGARAAYGDDGAGGETSYGNTFRAIASNVQFRPERVTPKPRVSGTMHAVVDSEGSGQYAELDEYGQYKVQLPFDLTDKRANKGSARVRMATPYAGNDHGMHFPLLRGAEVLLSFTDGDPDRPVIVGAVPNSENLSVVSQRNVRENRIATAGGNEIHMGDDRDKQVMWLHSPFHNSSIGIGSTDAKGGGSLWQSTAGSLEKITGGMTNSITLGTSNSISLAYKTSVDVSTSSSFALGISSALKVGFDASWSKGKKISIDDSGSVTLSTEGKLKGNEFVKISGGQRADVKAVIENMKTAVKAAVATSVAVQAAGAWAAAGAITGAGDEDLAAKRKEAWDKVGPSEKAARKLKDGDAAAAAKSNALSYGAQDKAGDATKKAEEKQRIEGIAAAEKEDFQNNNAERKNKLSASDQADYDKIRQARTDAETGSEAAFKKEVESKVTLADTKVGAGQRWSQDVQLSQGFVGAAVGVATPAVLLGVGAKLIDSKLKDVAYTSNIMADRKGVDLTVKKPKDPNDPTGVKDVDIDTTLLADGKGLAIGVVNTDAQSTSSLSITHEYKPVSAKPVTSEMVLSDVGMVFKHLDKFNGPESSSGLTLVNNAARLWTSADGSVKLATSGDSGKILMEHGSASTQMAQLTKDTLEVKSAKVSVTATAELNFKCGSAEMTLKSDSITLKVGTSTITLSGSQYEAKAGGESHTLGNGQQQHS